MSDEGQAHQNAMLHRAACSIILYFAVEDIRGDARFLNSCSLDDTRIGDYTTEAQIS
jgi:hypothetical protein